MKKSELKAIIKECILEILTEGLGNVGELTESRVTSNKRQSSKKRSVIDSILPKQDAHVSSPQQSADVYKEIAGNDVMAAIFADTAATTLHEQAAGHKNPQVDTGVDPNLFENAGNWATLAFSEPIKKQ